MEERMISSQIAVYKTNKKLCEFNDKLKLAPIECYAHTHAQGEELPDGSRPRSVVGIVLQDYSKGTGPNTVRVVANLSPGFFSYALSRVSVGVERFDFEEDKIFGEPDQSGRCTVTKVSIRRASVGKDGKPRNYPWYICVENGKAVKERTATGGFHMKAGTYVNERTVFININDYDFFLLMDRVARYIDIWELTNAPKLVRDAANMGIFGKLFDFDGDGETSLGESALGFAMFDDEVEAEKKQEAEDRLDDLRSRLLDLDLDEPDDLTSEEHDRWEEQRDELQEQITDLEIDLL